MKIVKRVLVALLCVTILSAGLTACGKNQKEKERELGHYDQLDSNKEYNRNLFYRNDLVSKAADPSVIYIGEGSEKGYFYMYATSDDIGTSGFQAWRSKDLVNWICTGVAFVPDRDSWARQNYWAPEVVYYKAEGDAAGKYYLYYNAWNVNLSNKHCLGLAVSDTPNGPFVQYTGKSGDRDITLIDPLVDASLFPKDSAIYNQPIIDASPFIDDDGKIYMYFVLDIQQGAPSSSIWGMKMKDMFTPDYDSVSQITEFGKVTVGGDESIPETNKTNEAPFMIKNDGKYYMTFSTSQYMYADYSVQQAVSQNPLTGFKKVNYDKGGRFLSFKGVNGEYDYDHMSGTGHHSFVKVGNELFAVYHAFVDRYNGTLAQGRAIATDRVFFVNNGEQEIIYTNGPSYSLQPLPAELSGYRNLSPMAQVSVSGGTNVEALTDGYYKNHNYDFIKEFSADGDVTVTFKFDKEINARAVMIYNSFDIDYAFSKVDKIAIKMAESGDRVIHNLRFDEKHHIFIDKNDPDFKIMRPGGAAIAEFNETKTDQIVFTFKSDKPINISDIVILGSEVA